MHTTKKQKSLIKQGIIVIFSTNSTMPNLIRLETILAQKLTLHKAKINCLSQMIIALITAQSSNLKKIARHFACATPSESNYRRIQRFLAHTELDEHQVASLIYNLFGLDKVTLTIDRTNWKWGKSNINIFMLAVVHQGIAIPLYWTMLDKRGNSSTLERTELIEKFIHNFGKDKIIKILADREFVGQAWFNWFTTENLKFAIRIKKDSKVFNSQGESVQIHTLFHNLSQQETYHHDRPLIVDKCPVKVSAKLDSDNDYVIVATNDFDDIDSMATYAKRWQIETLFSCFKGRGFNLEDTHLTIQERVSKLVAITALAFCWAYQAGLAILSENPNHYKRRPKANGRPQASIFAIGLDWLIDSFRKFMMSNDYAIFRQLLRCLTTDEYLPNLV